MAFDLRQPTAAASSEAGFTFEPRYPGSDKGIGATITVWGPRSEASRALSTRRIDENNQREIEARRGGREAAPLTLDEVERRMVENAVAYTKGWTGMTDGGAELQFTAEAAAKLYAAHPWVRDQVIREAQELGNFIKPALPSSLITAAPSSPSI